jgi:hypothetical protein
MLSKTVHTNILKIYGFLREPPNFYENRAGRGDSDRVAGQRRTL